MPAIATPATHRRSLTSTLRGSGSVPEGREPDQPPPARLVIISVARSTQQSSWGTDGACRHACRHWPDALSIYYPLTNTLNRRLFRARRARHSFPSRAHTCQPNGTSIGPCAGRATRCSVRSRRPSVSTAFPVWSRWRTSSRWCGPCRCAGASVRVAGGGGGWRRRRVVGGGGGWRFYGGGSRRVGVAVEAGRSGHGGGGDGGAGGVRDVLFCHTGCRVSPQDLAGQACWAGAGARAGARATATARARASTAGGVSAPRHKANRGSDQRVATAQGRPCPRLPEPHSPVPRIAYWEVVKRAASPPDLSIWPHTAIAAADAAAAAVLAAAPKITCRPPFLS